MIRRLAAVLAADAAGYSRLMHAVEERTHSEFTAIMKGSVEPALARYGGRLVKSTGDGFLAEFPSAVEAVRCALHFQDDIARRTSDDAPDLRLAFRVGINLGDVIIEPHDVFGDGVNTAARLEALAEPGGILIAAAVYEQVRGRVACRLEDLGEQRVKNIATPIRVYRVLPSEQIAAAVTVPGKPSIVVLPFQNISGDPEQEYFADGMVEEITISLSRIRWLFVIARNSAFTYKGRFIDVRQVSRELGVRYVLEGSVRKSANRLRISAQLIDATTAHQVWADRFDGDLSDVFELQDQVTEGVVRAVAPSMRLAEIDRARRKPPER
jgi:TolB-like protein